MNDDPALLQRQAAYVDTMRGLYRRERAAGFVACLAGALMLITARFILPQMTFLLWAGVAVIAMGWGLFVYAVVQRLSWVRAHPFDPKA
ncbi:MAG: hypothetical protein ACHP84_01655 [Caulobacterales bacterium]